MFPRSQRLPSQQIQAIFHRGRRVRGDGIDLISVPTKTSSRWAVIVSSSVDKRAVVRNRMKRLVREAIRRLLPKFVGSIDGVWMIRRALPDKESEVEKIVIDVLGKGGLLKEYRGL